MADAYKEAEVQGTSAVGTYATLYDTSGTGVTAVVAAILVVNTTTTAQTYRIGVMDSAGTPGAANWRAYDCTVDPNDVFAHQVPICMQNGRYIRVSSSNTGVTFAAEISEMTP